MIHPTAVIHPQAQVDPSVEVGPCAVLDAHVSLGPGCRVGPHVYLTGYTVVGKGNTFHAGCVIGDAPQDLKYKDEPTRVRIGDDNVFREHVTVHRANSVNDETVIGSGCLFMVGSHVGHNSHLGNGIIMANGAVLGGHVQVEDRVFISATCMVHQFARIGTLAFMQGGSGVSKDLPPFTLAVGNNRICGLNTIGLRRAGVSSAGRLELRRLYHALFRSEGLLRTALEQCRSEFASPESILMLDFVAAARRGVCSDVGSGKHEGDAGE